MVDPVYKVELWCGGEALEFMDVPASQARNPRRACEVAVPEFEVFVPIDPAEDYFRVIDPAGATWLWHFRDGKLVRLLRPPVSPGSLPPSP